MENINNEIIEKLDKLFDIAKKIQNKESNEESKNIINELVYLLNFYNIDYINAFDLTEYYNRKKEELTNYSNNLTTIRNRFIQVLINNNKIIRKNEFVKLILV